MKAIFKSSLADELAGFLAFKRARGYRYERAEFWLRSFDRFLSRHARRRPTLQFDEAILEWLESQPQRKPISISMEVSVFRELWRYLHRREQRRFTREPRWPSLPTQTRFVAHVLSLPNIRQLLRLIARLDQPRFRRSLYRAVFLVLYCTGLRFGEALRLRIGDIDLQRHVLYVAESKGRSRWIPFHPSLAVELTRYLRARRAFVGSVAQSDARLFVGVNRRNLPNSTAWTTFSKLYRTAGLKPARGRMGPRPYDLRHTFAVHRLTRWYRQGVDLHSRLPWLSAYLGHVNLLGTETYLAATPALLALVSERFRRRYSGRKARS